MSENIKSNKVKMKEFLGSTAFLHYSSSVVGFLVPLLGSALTVYISGRQLSDSQLLILLLLSFPWLFFSGIIVIVRKEVPRPGLKSIKGGWAVFLGFFIATVFGSSEVFLLYTLLQGMIYK